MSSVSFPEKVKDSGEERPLLQRAWETITEVLFIGPLRNLYLRGPAVGTFGFWHGQELPDICASLSRTSAAFWISQMPECLALIDKQFMAWITLITTLLYFVICFQVLKFVGMYVFFCLFYRPLLRRREPATHDRRLRKKTTTN